MSSADFTTFYGIDGKRLEEILDGISKIKVALIGDVCLDVYWRADMTKSELSRETPHFPLPVVEERMSPGGGGNAAANIAALKPAETHVLSVAGNDWRGKALIQELINRGIDTGGIIISDKIVTNAYCKPIRKGISGLEYEDPRIDFANYDVLPPEEEEKLLSGLEEVAGEIDVLCVSDQLAFGCITRRVREKIMEFGRQGLTVVVDSRDRIAMYTDVILKPNEIEGYRAVYGGNAPEGAAFEELLAAARILSQRNNSRVCMTLGPKGCIYVDKNKATYVPSYAVRAPIDTCGAGDTFLAAFSCALAAGAEGFEAASFANMAADVTIKKVGMTGTASPEEIRARYKEIRERHEEIRARYGEIKNNNDLI